MYSTYGIIISTSIFLITTIKIKAVKAPILMLTTSANIKFLNLKFRKNFMHNIFWAKNKS